MLQEFHSYRNNEENDFRQRVADQNIQTLEDRQEEFKQAKNGFIGMLAGIVVGGVVGWLFLGPSANLNKEKTIPVIHRPLTPAKVQPNERGGMEIDNQNREIYHIVDNTEKKIEEVKILPQPDKPQMIVEKNIVTPDDMENLVESIEQDGNIETEESFSEPVESNVQLAGTEELAGIKTNSREKIVIPEKIKEVEVKLQNTINSQKEKVVVPSAASETIKKTAPDSIKVVKQTTAPKGTWYTQIIASSSRKAVQSLWDSLSVKHTFLKTYPYEIEEITTGSGSTLYRLKVGAFKTRAEAVTLSEKLKKNQISSIIKQN